MANSIAYAKAYLDMLDKVYKKGAVTAGMEANPSNFKESEVAPNSIYVKKLSTDGLGDYSRTSGYVAGDTTVTWQAHTFSVDRGRKYNLDTMDAKEAYLQAAEIAAEIYRTHVIPEIDAYRFHKLVSLCSLDLSADLTYDTAIAAIDVGIKTLDDAEVPQEGRALYVSNEMYSLMKQSGEFFNVRIGRGVVMDREIETFDGMPLKRVPSARFYSAFDFNDGTTEGQTAGGFAAASGAKALNFIIAREQDVLGIVKHMAPKMIAPQNNPDADGYVFGLRVYHDLFMNDNKKSSVYIHSKA